MIRQLDKTAAAALAPLFDMKAQPEMTMALTCLQGHMGRCFAGDKGACALVIVGDFGFLAGDAAAEDAEALAAHMPAPLANPGFIYVPQSDAWLRLLLAVQGEKARRITRYAIREQAHFVPDALRACAGALPRGYRLAPIDAALYHQCMASPLRDLCSQFESAEDYVRRGRGCCVLHKRTVVGGASSYTVYDDGIEIEIDVLPAHRRRGLATACGAQLILACLAEHKKPRWDAANLASVALAQKLGYVFSHAYAAVAVRPDGWPQ